MDRPPVCFISYACESEEHCAWVRTLAEHLRLSGVDARLDQFHCPPGTDLPQYMEEGIRTADFVLAPYCPAYGS